MIEKVGPIKNPLTIIAIFAAIAEISGTIVLPFIDKSNQALYVWFLMIFPLLLILLFFLTLNFNHKVLYAPSDYRNEDNFLQSLPRASFTEKVQKIKAELAEAEPEAPEKLQSEEATLKVPLQAKPDISYQTFVRRSTQASYMLAEELIFRKLASEFSSEIQREVKLGTLGVHYIFDGIVRDKGVTTIIEVKFVRNGFIQTTHIKETLARIQKAVKLLPKEQSSDFRVLLAIATEEVNTTQEKVVSQIEGISIDFYFPIDVRFFSLAELEREFQIGA